MLAGKCLKRWSNDAVLAGKCLKRWSNDAVLSGKSVPPQFFLPLPPPPHLQIKLGGPIAVNCSGINPVNPHRLYIYTRCTISFENYLSICSYLFESSARSRLQLIHAIAICSSNLLIVNHPYDIDYINGYAI